MASYTSKYALKKPTPTEFYDIQDHNDNMDKVEAAILANLKPMVGTYTGDAITSNSWAQPTLQTINLDFTPTAVELFACDSLGTIRRKETGLITQEHPLRTQSGLNGPYLIAEIIEGGFRVGSHRYLSSSGYSYEFNTPGVTYVYIAHR